MKQRKASSDPHKKTIAPAFVVERGERAGNAYVLSVLFGTACTHTLVRQLEQRMIAHELLSKDRGFCLHEVAAQILDQCDEARIRALALDRIKQVAIDEIITIDEVGKRMFHEAEELRKKRSSVDNLLAEMSG